MFTVCEGCVEGGNTECPLYIFQTEDGFIFISCIVFGLIEMGASILARVDLDFGGEDGKDKV